MEAIIHRGEVVKRYVKLSGVSVTRVSQLLGKSRPTLNNWFSQQNLDYKIILQIGQAIKHDFTEQFPEIKMYKTDFLLKDENAKVDYPAKFMEMKAELDRWKTEAYTMAKELSEIKDKYYTLLLKQEK